MLIGLIVLGLIALALSVLLAWAWITARTYRKRFQPVFDLEAELRRLEQEKRSATRDKEAELSRLAGEQAKLGEEMRRRRSAWEREFEQTVAELGALSKQVDQVRDTADIQSYGVYEPVFDFDTPERYKEEIKSVRDAQKQLIREEAAAVCDTTWTVEGSATKGKQMVKRMLKLQLRAFNGECDAGVAKVRFDNISAISERIEKSWAAINQLGETNRCRITDGYLRLKLDELRLTHEYARKKHEEKEAQREEREQLREEEKARREIEKAQRDAEAEEARYAAALEQARSELASATSATEKALRKKVELLQQQFEQAHERKAKAISRAQLTKSGYVYVISNVGSFGPDVFKIGMTRRMEPLDRVKELGDASVPFGFDVHSMIYSEDAPALEAELHRRLADRQINLINNRREFFRASLAEIERQVHDACGQEVEFVRTAVAEEYRESIALHEKRQAALRAEAEKVERADVLNARTRLDELKKGWRAEPV